MRFRKLAVCATLATCVSTTVFSEKIDRHPYKRVQTVDDISSLYLTSVSEIQKYKEDALNTYKLNIESFLEVPLKKRTIDNTLQQYDAIEADIGESAHLLYTIGMVEPNEALRTAYINASVELNKAYLEFRSQHKELHKVMTSFQKRMKRRKSFKRRHEYMLSQIILDMQREGLHLTGEKADRVKTLNHDLIALTKEFAKNIRDDESYVKATKEDLSSLHTGFVDQLQQDENGNYKLTCDYPTYLTTMKYCDKETVRKDLFRAFSNRAYPQNIEVLHKIIKKRDQLANELGHKSFAHYQLSNEMVKTPEKAQEFLDLLSERSKRKEKLETLELKKILNLPLDDSKMDIWNGMYAREKLKARDYSYDDNLVKQYFPIDSTLSGLMSIYEEFFDLEIKEEPISNLWHEDVRLIKISNKQDKKLLGYILMDLFPRKYKYSHACSAPIYMGLELPDGSARPTVNLLIMNFTKKTENTPSLLTLNQVRTFFHEFGHGVHAVLGRTEYVYTSGYNNVKVDFVELPSQMLEEWLCQKEILKKISCHYKTGKPLSDELIDKIISSRKMDSGYFVLRQCLLSDLSLSCFLEGDDKDTIDLYQKLHAKSGSSFAYDIKSHFQASFGHLDEYGARYYGYLWSRVFALDVFSQIQKEGLLNPEAGKRYVKEILGKGGSEDPEILLKNYLGREPTIDAFLQAYGIN